jgi:iron complex transport system substrate-binding protein
MRICSLLPSATEIVAALGFADSLVAVSEECDWPREIQGLPVATASRVDTRNLSSARIDAAVRGALAEGESLYAMDADLIDRLKPDLILTQNLCSVCAVSADAVNELCGTDAEVYALDAHTLQEIADGVVDLAEKLGVRERGVEVAQEMHVRLETVRRRVAAAPRRAVFVAEWLDPPFASGHWLPEMVEAAGGYDVLGRVGMPSRVTSWEEVLDRGPELVIAAPCGLDHTKAAAEASRLALGCRVVAVDANSYYARPAPRVVAGVEQLAFLIHPELAHDPGLPWIEV